MADPSYNAKVYLEQGASALVVASGGSIRIEPGGAISGATAVGSFVFATGEISASDLAGNLTSGTLDLGPHLIAAREAASGETLTSGTSAPGMFWGGILNVDTTPSQTLLSSADQSLCWTWASGNSDGMKLPPIALPTDLSTAAGLNVDVFGESIGTGTASDAKSAFDIRCWSGVGDTEMGATHPDFTSTPTWRGITVASGDITTGPLNITLVPETHAGRGIRLLGARIRYTRSS